MSDSIAIQNTRPAAPIQTARSGRPGAGGSSKSGEPLFQELLQMRQGLASEAGGGQVAAEGDLRFSAHAQTRLRSRHIALAETHLDRLNGAVARAANKGSRDALVLMDDLAMVVSVKNRTVVTVVDREHLKENVFTNIDSAVIA